MAIDGKLYRNGTKPRGGNRKRLPIPMKKPLQGLTRGTRLDEYEIEATLGGGGFSIAYLARNARMGRVVIKEYLPGRIAERAPDGNVLPLQEQADQFNRGLKLFFQEAATLATLKHPNIVNVISFFRANGTACMVMEYEDGKNLQEYIRVRRGGLSEVFLRTVFPPLLDALQCIHSRGLLHLDIKPGNIHLRPGGRPLLLDFGAVHRFQHSRRKLPGRVSTPGFSPIEQHESGGYVGPWTDLYAIGATMYTCIEGSPPPSAEQRRECDTLAPAAERFRGRYCAALLRTIDWALEVDPLLRPQSVGELIEAFGQPENTAAPLQGNVES
jgi:serine/threonine protein kinase